MRLQLITARRGVPARCVTGFLALLALLALLSMSQPAAAEQLSQNPAGEVAFRGNYWRDRNTRVLNPAVDVRQDLANGVSLGGHYLLDAITSASVAAGVTADKPFTEMRHEAGFNIAVPLERTRRHKLAASYRYSTESDYFSHSAGLRISSSLFRDNTTLLFGGDYGHNTVGKRLGPTGYLLMGSMHAIHLVGAWTQLISPSLLGTVSYEVTINKGFQENPYRPVFVGGERREIEKLPDFRVRHVIAMSLHHMTRLPSDLVPHLTLRPGLRIHSDCWGLRAVQPELSLSVPVGPVELSGLFSYYGQSEVSFYRAEAPTDRPGIHPNVPIYTTPVQWQGCPDPVAAAGTAEDVYTSDVKLGTYSTYTGELMIKWRLSFLRGVMGAVGERLSRSVLELTGGMWFADQAVGWQYGIPLQSDDPFAPAGCGQICGAGFANLGLTVPL